METYVVRVWLPDRPGALGAVASRIGAVRGDVVGIDILETGGGQAVDELAVRLPRAQLVDLLVSEIEQVDGVRVEDIRPVVDAVHDPRLDALETAARLVGAATPDEVLTGLCTHGLRTLGGEWLAVIDLDERAVRCSAGTTPPEAWLTAFVEGSQAAAAAGGGPAGAAEPTDVAWSPLAGANLAMVIGRTGTPFRARERHQVAAMARIADTRVKELKAVSSKLAHPSRG